ncbi:MAG: hypothetical protein JWQ11_4143 [Rhizobacter sp.]|nr:hypothetical protein [Rhizobacter sp.]
MHTHTFTLLALAIEAVWLPPIRLAGLAAPAWPLIYTAALLSALASGVVSWTALPAIASFAALVFAAVTARSSGWRGAANVACALVGLALLLHKLPGFHNPKLFDAVQISANAPPFTQYLNFDKATAGLFMLAAFAPRPRAGDTHRAMLSSALVLSLLTTVGVLGLATALGIVRVDPKWPASAWAFLAANLLFTCVADEAFFRGLIQERLAAIRPSSRALTAIAVVLSTGLFAATHLPGGLALTGLAGLAGLGYAFAYQKTHRVEVAIGAHFMVNAAHFLLFTYPYALE